MKALATIACVLLLVSVLPGPVSAQVPIESAFGIKLGTKVEPWVVNSLDPIIATEFFRATVKPSEPNQLFTQYEVDFTRKSLEIARITAEGVIKSQGQSKVIFEKLCTLLSEKYGAPRLVNDIAEFHSGPGRIKLFVPARASENTVFRIQYEHLGLLDAAAAQNEQAHAESTQGDGL